MYSEQLSSPDLITLARQSVGGKVVIQNHKLRGAFKKKSKSGKGSKDKRGGGSPDFQVFPKHKCRF